MSRSERDLIWEISFTFLSALEWFIWSNTLYLLYFFSWTT